MYVDWQNTVVLLSMKFLRVTHINACNSVPPIQPLSSPRLRGFAKIYRSFLMSMGFGVVSAVLCF